jgi:hypothetical protein
MLNAEFSFNFIIGHIVGDYILQNNWMALNKKNSVMAALVHCIVYTVAICVSIYQTLLQQSIERIIIVAILVFLSHVVLDYTDLVDSFLHAIRGRSWKRSFDLASKQVNQNIASAIIAYTAIVQTVVDNALHIIMMYFIFKLILF